MARDARDPCFVDGPGVRSLRVTAATWELLERTSQLAALGTWLEATRNDGHGRIVFVGGEAGVGKTSLLRRFCDEQPGSVRILWGGCSALHTPRPLGPLLDIAEITGGALEELVESDTKPHQVVKALVDELRAPVRRLWCSRISIGPTRQRSTR